MFIKKFSCFSLLFVVVYTALFFNLECQAVSITAINDEFDIIPCNSTLPVCLQRPIRATNSPSKVSLKKVIRNNLSVIYLFGVGCNTVLNDMATLNTLAIMYNSQIGVYWLDVSRHVRFLGKMLNLFDLTGMEDVELESLPKLLVVSQENFLMETFGHVDIVDIINVLREVDPFLYSEVYLRSKYDNDKEIVCGFNNNNGISDNILAKQIEKQILVKSMWKIQSCQINDSWMDDDFGIPEIVEDQQNSPSN